MKGPIQAFEVSFFIHATEDEGRVIEAVRSSLDFEGEPVKEEMQGHYGNPIVRVSFKLVGDEAGRAVEKLAALLPSAVKSELTDNLSSFVDEHSALYLRLDKQLTMRGKLGLGSVDPVRIRMKPRLFLMKGGSQGFYSRILGLDAA